MYSHEQFYDQLNVIDDLFIQEASILTLCYEFGGINLRSSGVVADIPIFADEDAVRRRTRRGAVCE